MVAGLPGGSGTSCWDMVAGLPGGSGTSCWLHLAWHYLAKKMQSKGVPFVANKSSNNFSLFMLFVSCH
jgi:hypothetical protein